MSEMLNRLRIFCPSCRDAFRDNRPIKVHCADCRAAARGDGSIESKAPAASEAATPSETELGARDRYHNDTYFYRFVHTVEDLAKTKQRLRLCELLDRFVPVIPPSARDELGELLRLHGLRGYLRAWIGDGPAAFVCEAYGNWNADVLAEIDKELREHFDEEYSASLFPHADDKFCVYIVARWIDAQTDSEGRVEIPATWEIELLDALLARIREGGKAGT